MYWVDKDIKNSDSEISLLESSHTRGLEEKSPNSNERDVGSIDEDSTSTQTKKQKQSYCISKRKERTAGRIADNLDNSTSVGSMGKDNISSL